MKRVLRDVRAAARVLLRRGLVRARERRQIAA
jgi:hypothetical protein